MDPVTMTVISTAFSVFGAVQQGNSAKKIGEYNAAVARRNAEAARAQAGADARAKERESIQRLGSIRAAYGASGVASGGSPLDVLSTNAALLELDKQNLLYRGELRGMGYESDAALAQAEGKAGQTAGYLKAGGALMSGAGKVYDYLNPPKKGE